ncbi:Protein toll [Orchesella cincta]|uniref:Protein toll n=1 Tax=Orchesella cincta TaxID=48709 RepID=A0A1D2N3K3_ORCCI|nr:Protein toll [Orchesella cincta]
MTCVKLTRMACHHRHHGHHGLLGIFQETILVLALLFLSSASGKYLEGCEKVPVLSPSSSNSDISLSCKLRTINSEFDKTNFSSLSGDIVSLNLECSNVLFYQSSLYAGFLSHMSNKLQTLTIEHCKISRISQGVFSGLSLKNLTIRTHNTAWPALSLDIASTAFNQSHLENLDISCNNIWTLPSSLLCQAKSLKHLNVSRNRLQDITDLGFREREDKNQTGGNRGGCRIGLQTLDVSYNRLILLPARGLASLSQLKHLYLQGNEISMIAETALAGLGSLNIVNFTDNKVSTLPAKEQRHNGNILQNNSLVTLPLFQGLKQLVILDLSYNSLTSAGLLQSKSQEGFNNNENNANNTTTDSEVTTNAISTSSSTTSASSSVFAGLIRLVLLDIGHNELTRLTPELFQDLYSLQYLSCENNAIETIDPHTFSSLNNLHTLLLSNNRLKTVEVYTFNGGLSVLSLLSLDSNEISYIHEDAFLNVSSIRDLNLNGNAFEKAPALQHLTLLKTIDLGENQIESLEPLSLPNLYGLRLTGNRIVNVTKDVLKDLPMLRVLNLARNRINSIEKGSFDANTNLQAVRLDSNFLEDISNLFSEKTNPSLIWLNVSDNRLTWFDYALIPKQLQWLDIHKNEIPDLGNYYGINDLHLQTLDASFNRLTKIGPNNIPDSIEMLFLNDNLISTIEPDTFFNKANLSRVDIFSNQIETLEIRALQLSPFPTHKALPEFYIAGNPILCDCTMDWLQRLNNKHLRQHPNVVDLESIYCKLVYRNYYVPLTEADPSQFLCSYKTHCFTTCECCEFDACDCEMTCPDGCNCYRDATWMSNIVDCSAREHTSVPKLIPMDSTEVYLDGNNFPELTSHGFIGKKNLKVLYLNNSNIESIQNNSFSGLKLLTTLHLENNLIKTIHEYIFEPLESTRELYLQNNQISYIAPNSFVNLKMLEVLKLDNNRLFKFEMWTLTRNPYLVEIAISNNPFSCECDYVSKASEFIQNNQLKLLDPQLINCRVNNGRQVSLKYMNATKCLEIKALSGVSEHSETNIPPYAAIALLLTVISICLLIGFVFFCRKRNSLRIWGATKCPLNQCYQTAETDDRLYDAYIAYSVSDESWVSRIGEELQQQGDLNHPYRLCYHHKDFPVTQAYVSEKIMQAADSSRCVLLVLSKSFLQNEWRFEFKSALAALRKRNRLICVTLGDLPARDLEPDLRVFLNKATLLSANDKLFWSKLKCALPEPRPPFSSRTLVSRPGSGGSDSGANSVHNYTPSSLGGCSTLPLNISDSSCNSNYLHHLNLNQQQLHPHHHTMTMSHHPPPTHQFFSNTLGGGNTNGFLLQNGNNTTSHHHHHLNGISNGNCNNPNNNSSHSDSNGNNGAVSVPLYVPRFPLQIDHLTVSSTEAPSSTCANVCLTINGAGLLLLPASKLLSLWP